MTHEEPVIGRGAILLLLVTFILVLIGMYFSAEADAVKNLRPDCLPTIYTASCAVLPGSTDTSGFLTITARRKGDPASNGSTLGGLLFHCQWDDKPTCELRPENSDYPRTQVITTRNTLEVVLQEDARLPLKMRWFYVCR